MRQTYRTSSGSLAALAFVALVPLVLAIGGFSVDCMHVNDERGALQRATDAGALAGAIDIPSWKGTLSQSGTTNSGTNYAAGKTGTNEEPVDMALSATALNVVDGRRPVTNGKGTTILAEMLQQYQPTMQQSSQGNPPTACHVHAQMPIRSIFSGLFGNWQQTISCDSIAGPGQPITTLYRYLPVLLSAPQGDQNGSFLQAMWPGGGYGLNLNAPGVVQPSGNGGAPYAHGNVLWILPTDAANQSAINAVATGTPANPPEPAITIDSTVTTQPPGTNFPGAMAAFNTSLKPGMTVIVPVTSDPLTAPDPKTGAAPTSGPHKVIGFVALQIQHSTGAGTWWVNIVPAIGQGTSGGPQDPAFMSSGFLPTDRVSGISLVR